MISERYATVNYLFDLENVSGKSDELKFDITIHSDAFISNFTAKIDGELFIGKTKEKEEAKNEYNAAKRKEENAVLITRPYDNIPNVFHFFLLDKNGIHHFCINYLL